MSGTFVAACTKIVATCSSRQIDKRNAPHGCSSSGDAGGAGAGAGSDADSFLLIGHSTGCQDAVFYMKHGRPDLRKRVVGVVLQAPVSDREQLETLPGTEGFVKEARARGGGGELMPVEVTDAPITAARFLSLATKVCLGVCAERIVSVSCA